MGWISVVTNVGNALLAQWVSGATLTITSAKAGTGTVATTQLVNQTALVTEKQTMSIVDGKTITTGAKLKLQMTAPQTAYTLNQIGVFAKIGDGTPVLLALCQNADGVAIPDATSSPDFLYTFFPVINMSNTGTLNLTIDTSAVVSQDTMEDYAEALNNKKTVVNSSSTDTDYPSAKAVYDAIEARMVTHRNLIDNPWFTVNQRGLTSCPSSGFCLDRWMGIGTGYSVVSNMPVVPSDDYIRQGTDPDFYDSLVGKTLTWSVMLNGGTVYSGSAVLHERLAPGTISPGIEVTVIDNDYFTCGYIYSYGITRLFYVKAKTSITIKAVKLELGSISTLANDVPPNYAEELLKCQRYYFNSGSGSYGAYVCTPPVASTYLVSNYRFPVEMRGVPTVTIKSCVGTTGSVSIWEDNTDTMSGSIAMTTTIGKQGFNGVSNANNFTAGQSYSFHIEASADI